jgi:hypothetical protein
MQQEALITVLGFPFCGSYQKLGVLAHPAQIGVDRCSQPLDVWSKPRFG